MVRKPDYAPYPESLTGVGERIRLARHHRGWRQSELAEGAGLGANTPHVVETGKRIPSIEIICRCAAALQVPPEWLAFGVEPSGLPDGSPKWAPYPSGEASPRAVPAADREHRRMLNQQAFAASKRNGTTFHAERDRLRAEAMERRKAQERVEEERQFREEAIARYGFDPDAHLSDR